MSPETAKTLAAYVLGTHAQETATTRNVLAACPAGKESYSPDDRSMNTLKLAWHIASAEVFFLNGVAQGAFAAGEPDVPEAIKNVADVIAWYDANLPAAVEAVKGLSGETLAKEIDFFGMFNAPGVVYVDLMLRHSIHHRGQLSAYLRPMGAKVPGIYGPSGDAPIQK